MSSEFSAHTAVPAPFQQASIAGASILRKRLPPLGRELGDGARATRSGSIRHTPLTGVSVWYLWHTDHSEISAFNQGLTPADLAEFADLHNAAARNRSLATRALLRTALSEAAGGVVRPSGWTFERGAHGQPQLLNPLISLHFSCSHTPALSVVAVSRSYPIGIDIETEFSDLDDPTLIEEFFTAEEQLAINCTRCEGRAKARTRLWTLKEAVVKMLGMGLALDVSKLEFDTVEDRLNSCRDAAISISGVRLATWSVPNHTQPLSVALAVKN